MNRPQKLAAAARAFVSTARVPLLVGLSGVAVSLVMWQELNAQQTRRVHRAVQSEVAAAARQMEGDLAERARVLTQIAQYWDRIGEDLSRREAASYAAGQRGCLGVARVGPAGDIRWVVNSGPSGAPPTHAEFGGDGLEAALRDGRPALARPPRSRWGGFRVLLVFAPHESGSPRGGLIAAMRADQWVDAILHPNVAAGYALTVTDRGDEVYGRLSADRSYQGWEQSLPVGAHGQSWRLHAWPTQEVMDAEGSVLPGLSLAVGLFAAVLLSLAAHLVRAARRHASELVKEVHEREAVQATLRRSEALHRSLTENLDQGVFLKDRDGRYVAANNAFCRGVGRTEAEVIGRTDADLFGGEEARSRVEDERQARATGRVEGERTTRVAGQPRLIRHTLSLVKDGDQLLGITWDVTDQRAIEVRLGQSQKMDAIGQLAGGIAHDFNNLLTAILGNLELLLTRLPPDDPCRKFALAAHGAGGRAADLTRRLLGFSRQHQMDWQPTDLNIVVDEVVALLGRTIDPRVSLVARPCPALWPVQADPGQINQVLMNLCLNARDAIPGAGRITVETARVGSGEVTAPAGQADAGGYVRLRVEDTGGGMTDELKARIFEPFFTTKEVGKGTGLGLAMVFSIVEQHCGWIECHSEVGRGTRFDIYLPRTTDAARPTTARPTTARPATAPALRTGRGTVLVADDEPEVRQLVTLLLEHSGFTVLEAKDGREAVEVYEREGHRIDLVLLDLTMPRLSGQEAFHLLLALNPRVKAIFASGYAKGQIDESVQKRIAGFVAKPYRAEDLVRAIIAALEQPDQDTPRDVGHDLGGVSTVG